MTDGTGHGHGEGRDDHAGGADGDRGDGDHGHPGGDGDGDAPGDGRGGRSLVRTMLADGGAPADGGLPEDAGEDDPQVGARDPLLVGAAVLAVIVVFSGVGFALGLSTNGIVNTVRLVLFYSAVYGMVVLALNLHWGYAGIFNIGVAGFMAVGVYTMAIVSRPANPAINSPATPPGLGLPLFVGILAGVLAAALVGALAALPALRLRADYLAIVTIAFSEIIRLLYNTQVFQEFTVAGVTIGTGGASGLSLPANPVKLLFYAGGDVAEGRALLGTVLFPVADAVGIQSTVVVDLFYVVVLAAFVAGFYWLLLRVGNSPFGRVLKAIREDEDVAQALGKDTRVFKIKAFMLGCGLMGLAGILWQGSQSYANPNAFRPILTFYVWIALIIGGAGSNTGGVLGGIAFASLLFQGPVYVRRIVESYLELGSTPNNIFAAVGPLLSADPTPFLAYVLGNLFSLRLVLVGVVLVALMQRRPEGLLGHRKEIAASIDLSRPPDRRDPRTDEAVAADGGPTSDEGTAGAASGRDAGGRPDGSGRDEGGERRR